MADLRDSRSGAARLFPGTLSIALVAGLLPWIWIVSARGPYVLFLFVVLLLIVSGLGYGALRLSRLLRGKELLRWAFAPAIGFILLAGSIGTGVYLRVPISVTLRLACVAGCAGLVFLVWRCLRSRAAAPKGSTGVVLMSWLIACLILRTIVAVDGTVHSDGRFMWIDVDAQYDMAVAASVKTQSPPMTPGLSAAGLRYHWGAYALASACSADWGVTLGDALVQVKALGLLCLLCAAAGFGSAFARIKGSAAWAPAFSIIGLFFFGSFAIAPLPSAVWTTLIIGGLCIPLLCLWGRPAGWVTTLVATLAVGALLALRVYCPSAGDVLAGDVHVLAIPRDLGMLSHFFIGHSVLWGMIGIVSLFGIVVADWGTARTLDARYAALMVIGALTPSLNAPSGLAITGTLIAVPVLMWARKRPGLVVGGLVMISVAVVVGCLRNGADQAFLGKMGLFQLNTTTHRLAWLWLGMGAALYALGDVRTGKAPVVTTLLLVFTTGSLLTACLGPQFTRTYPNHLYLAFFLSHTLGMTAWAAFSWVPTRAAKLSIHAEVRVLLNVWFWVALSSAAVLAAFSIVVRARTGSAANVYTVDAALLLLVGILIGSIAKVSERSRLVRGASVLVILLLVVLGLLASYPDAIATYMHAPSAETVFMSETEHASLLRLRTLSKPGDLMATNRHHIYHREFGGRLRRGRLKWRSYGYSAILERPVFVEGLFVIDTQRESVRKSVQQNSVLFESSDQDQVRDILQATSIRYLICRPGTDIQLNEPKPRWLEPVSEIEKMNVYRVNL